MSEKQAPYGTPKASPDREAPPIWLKIGVTGDGTLCLYDAVTGRIVSGRREISAEIVDPCEDLQIAYLEVITDPRVSNPRAAKILERLAETGETA